MRKHTTLVALASMLALVLSATSATAGSGATVPENDKAQTWTGTAQVKDKAGVTTTVTCSAIAAPVPQYSNFNGFRTVQWGAKVVCDAPLSIFISTSLYTVEGVGDREHNVLQDSKTIGPTVGFDVGNSWGEPCLSGGSARWVASRTPTAEGFPFVPPVRWTSVITLPCLPI